jgi:hypothetical protein
MALTQHDSRLRDERPSQGSERRNDLIPLATFWCRSHGSWTGQAGEPTAAETLRITLEATLSSRRARTSSRSSRAKANGVPPETLAFVEREQCGVRSTRTKTVVAGDYDVVEGHVTRALQAITVDLITTAVPARHAAPCREHLRARATLWLPHRAWR